MCGIVGTQRDIQDIAGGQTLVGYNIIRIGTESYKRRMMMSMYDRYGAQVHFHQYM